MGRVKRLTGQQWEQLRAVRDEYVAASLCTEPADRPAAEAAIERLYRLAGYRPPQFIWCDSPASARLVIWLATADDRAWPPAGPGVLLDRMLRSSYDSSLVCQTEKSMQRSLEGALGRHVASALQALFGASAACPVEWRMADALDDLLREPFADLFGGSLGDSVRCSLPKAPWPPSPAPPPLTQWYTGSRWDHFAGQHDTGILRYEAPRRLGIVSYRDWDNEWLDQLCVLARTAGWWWPYQRACVVAERPAVMRAEQPGGEWGQVQLHCPDGPALVFPDGWSVHAWHGTRVPATLVEGSWDIAAILAEPNSQIRRCAIEKIGWDTFEEQLVPVASAPDPGNPGQLLSLCALPREISDTYARPVRLLLCSNGTPEPDGIPRRYALHVPAYHTDPVAAAAELYGWTRAEYTSLARRA